MRRLAAAPRLVTGTDDARLPSLRKGGGLVAAPGRGAGRGAGQFALSNNLSSAHRVDVTAQSPVASAATFARNTASPPAMRCGVTRPFTHVRSRFAPRGILTRS